MADAQMFRSNSLFFRRISTRVKIWFVRGLMVLAASAAQSGVADVDIPALSGEQTATVDGASFKVFTFRPTGCEIAGILVVAHGVDRNADAYQDDAIPLAQQNCLLTIAPLFDRARFPGWRYQRGGIVHRDKLQPESLWTTGLVRSFVAWAQARAGRPDLPYVLIGHSAGAQFLSRVAAYQPGMCGVLSSRTLRPGFVHAWMSRRPMVSAHPSQWQRLKPRCAATSRCPSLSCSGRMTPARATLPIAQRRRRKVRHASNVDVPFLPNPSKRHAPMDGL